MAGLTHGSHLVHSRRGNKRAVELSITPSSLVILITQGLCLEGISNRKP